MKAGKYYDWEQGGMLIQDDSSSYDAWQHGGEKTLVLHALEIGHSSSCCTSKSNRLTSIKRAFFFETEFDLESAFHQMRIDMTMFLLERFAESGRKIGRLLDVGCGPGYFLEAVRKRFPEVEVGRA